MEAKLCSICSAAFVPRREHGVTCGPACSAIHRAAVKRARLQTPEGRARAAAATRRWADANPDKMRQAQERKREKQKAATPAPRARPEPPPTTEHFDGVGWAPIESAAMSRRPNPNRPQVQADIDAFLAAGGTIQPATASRQLRCESRGKHGEETRWSVAPPEAKLARKEAKR